ncbi:MAG TPA: NfeD family protein [Candidatus Dormibacteraeota bacterium]|jgi:membrane protein implicated in regulation of membrane protease activity
MTTADLVFGGCLLIGGGLLLMTLIFDDLLGGFLNAFHFGLDLGGVSPTPVLLGFVAMFGVGGLLGINGFGLGVGLATLVGVVAGVVGAAVVLAAFRFLRQAESTDTFSLEDMVGATGRVSVGIPANRFGTVLISFAGASHNMTATADAEIPAGRMVKVVAVAGTNLVVAPTSPVST